MQQNDVVGLYEMIVAQQRAICELRLSVEALKSMMFTHRPQFVEEFAKHIEVVDAREDFQRMNAALHSLEAAVAQLREGKQ